MLKMLMKPVRIEIYTYGLLGSICNHFILLTCSCVCFNIDWGLGSHIVQSYDIFPLTSIGQGVTASVDHKLLYIDSVPHGNVSDILALSDGVHPSEITGLYIEPGRVFYHTVEFCDLAHSCITSSPRQAMLLSKLIKMTCICMYIYTTYHIAKNYKIFQKDFCRYFI